MQSSLLADDDLPDAAALAANVARRATPGHFDELRGAPGVNVGASAGAIASAGASASARVSASASASASAAAGPLAAPWQTFFGSLGLDGWGDLAARQARVRQRVREDGATYNVYADADDHSRPWPLELLPALINADDWARIEAGVVQRARLMEQVLADIYGPQTLLRDALLPASMVFAHPQYLRPAHGIWQVGQVGQVGQAGQVGKARLHIAAFDLMRRPNGSYSVLAQRVQAPSGLGYLLENRLIVGPMFHDQFAALRVQRLAASFRLLLDGLMRASPAGERSRIALLTPGPLNETYFEQVFLARYLGITLVEGSDLTVRGNKLFLKSLHGLEQVHVLLRRVDDEFLDPLELRPDSALGVPGLMQALRAGEVVMANPPGAGFLESPGLAAFWPGVAERLLGVPLLLPASTSWWCGEPAVWAAQRDWLADFVVSPTFPDSDIRPLVAAYLSPAERAALVARIDADPAAYCLQARVRPGETPVWADGQLLPRSAVIRVFALADGAGGWRVLPGALTRVSGRDSDKPGDRSGDRPGDRSGNQPGDQPADKSGDTSGNPPADKPRSAHDPWLSMQHGSASVDTWVIARGAVDDSSLLPKPLTAAELTGWHRSVSSRAAENLYWLGRYTERAENAARLVRVTLETVHGASEPALRLLGDLAQYHGLVAPGVPSPTKSPRVFERALLQGLRADPPAGSSDNHGNTRGRTRSHTRSVSHSLHRLRQCAQALRERLSPEHWKLIHEVDDHFAQHLAAVLDQGDSHAPVPDVLGVLARAATHLAAITGAQTDRMTRDDGWRLLSVGRQIERLHMLSHALALGFEHRVHEADDGFALLLNLFDSVITYRAQFQARREVLPLLHLLVMDTDNPRSLAWVARTLRDRLRKLARHDAPWAQQVTAGFILPEDWPFARLASTDSAGRHTVLIDTLQQCCADARGLSDEIGRHLFAHVEAPDRRVWQ